MKHLPLILTLAIACAFLGVLSYKATKAAIDGAYQRGRAAIISEVLDSDIPLQPEAGCEIRVAAR